MLWDTRKAVFDSLLEFSPATRSKHHIVKLASGKWTRTVGPPSETKDALGRIYRVVHVKGREVPPDVHEEKEWWQRETPVLHATKKKSPAQLDREIAEALGQYTRPISSRKCVRHFSESKDKRGGTHYYVTYEDRSGHPISGDELRRYRRGEQQRRLPKAPRSQSHHTASTDMASPSNRGAHAAIKHSDDRADHAAYRRLVQKAIERCTKHPRRNHSLFECAFEEVHRGMPYPTQEERRIFEDAVHAARHGGAHARKRKLAPRDAKQLLKSDGIDFGRDFHELGSQEVQRILEVAKLAGYRKRKDAPGSTARMYFQYLSRQP